MSEVKITLEDCSNILDIEKLEKVKPRIVIMATQCGNCNKIHIFIFSGKILYYMQTYFSWHLHRDCECGNEVSVYSGHGDIVFNPHDFVPK